MSPAIRLGDRTTPIHTAPPPAAPRLDRKRVTVADVPTRMIHTRGRGTPVVLLHGWLDNAETWLAVLERLGALERSAVAYDQPGFGVAPPLGPGSVLDQLTDFASAAVERAAERSGRKVVVAGNSLGGWVALRLAEREDLPLAGIVPIGPAGIVMAPFFFTVDRIPAVSRIINMPAPVPPALVQNIVARFYRSLAFAKPAGVEQAVVDRFTRFNVERAVITARIDYAKRLRAELDDAFDPERIKVPVTAIWGERDRLCPSAGATELQERLPHARVDLLPEIGHTPQIECPDVVVRAIEELSSAAGSERAE